MLSSIRLFTHLRSSWSYKATRVFGSTAAKPVKESFPEDGDEEGWKMQSYDPKDFGPDDVIDATMHGTLEWLISSPPELHLFDEPPIIYEAEPAKKA